MEAQQIIAGLEAAGFEQQDNLGGSGHTVWASGENIVTLPNSADGQLPQGSLQSISDASGVDFTAPSQLSPNVGISTPKPRV